MPAVFFWQGRRYRVLRVEAVWKEMGPWWDGDGERTFFRVAAAAEGSGRSAPGLYELCWDEAAAGWSLARLID